MKRIVILLLMIMLTNLYSQDISLTIISTGGDFISKANGSVGWTIGEPVTGTISNGTYCLTQGFQQGSIIVSDVKEELPSSCSIKAFPVPALDLLNIECKLDREAELSFVLTDVNGQTVYRSKQNSNSQFFTADISKIPAGTYILTVSFGGGRYYKNIKIIKIY